MMKRFLAYHLWALFVGAFFLLTDAGQVRVAFAQPSSQVSMQAYDAKLAQRQKVLSALHVLETRYRTVVSEIDTLKRSGRESLATRRELENLMRQGRQLAEELEALQATIQQIDIKLETYRKSILGALDAQVQHEQQRLHSDDPVVQAQATEQLKTLEQMRQTYLAPMQEAPSYQEVHEFLATLESLDAHDDPSALLAAADELDDAADQIRNRLELIEEQMKGLRATKMLHRRARTFSREESFFEEQGRSRVIARYERPQPASTGANRSANNNNNNAMETTTSSAPAPESTTQNDHADVMIDRAESPPSAGAESADYDDSFAADEPATAMDTAAEAGEQHFADPRMQPTSETSSSDGFSSTDSHSASPREKVLFESGADPALGLGSMPGADFEQNLRMLEDEHEKLRRQAEQLRKKADTLRKNARDALQ